MEIITLELITIYGLTGFILAEFALVYTKRKNGNFTWVSYIITIFFWPLIIIATIFFAYLALRKP